MTKAEQIYNSDKDPREKYNELLEMWGTGVTYSEENELTDKQYTRFAEIPKYLSKLLDIIEPSPWKRTVRDVFEGFKTTF